MIHLLDEIDKMMLPYLGKNALFSSGKSGEIYETWATTLQKGGQGIDYKSWRMITLF
jgi:hypothetical protein